MLVKILTIYNYKFMGYEVKKGDGWYRIAKNLGVNVNELLKANNATLDTMLQPGQKLKTSKTVEQPTTLGPWQTVAGQNSAVTNWAQSRVDNTINTINQATAQKEAEEQEIQRKASIGTKGIVQQQAKADTIRLQQALLKEGYDLGRWGTDGNWGNATNDAIKAAEKDGWIVDGYKLVKKPKPQVAKNNSTPQIFGAAGPEYAVMALGQHHKNRPNKQSNDESWQTIKQVGSNFVRNPLQTGVDVALYTADKMGAPTNATNYLRDLNVSIPYRVKNALHAGYKTIMGDKSFKENYDELLANPGWYTDFSTIRPLTNTNTNFSNEELQVIRDAAGEDFQIDNADIKRVSEDGKYGKNDALTKYFSPSKVFQTAIGQSSGNSDNKVVTDVFDVNTVGDRAQKDNEMYLKEAKKNLGPNYATMRASMPYLNMIDIMPNKFKIHTKLKFNE